ncbi:MAG: hypothetical protein KBE04_08420 [Phycisphaerae bacterium]|nr:hypothetical protein [Phycisphaerae bacterium]
MDTLAILAEAADAAPLDPNVADPIIRAVWSQVVKLGPVEALTFISFGVVCLVYGWRIYKVLTTICFGLVGLVIGVLLNERLVGGNVVWLCAITTSVFVILSVLFMKWGVCILGATAGTILAGGVWLGFNLPLQYLWAGSLTGLVAGGLISFAAFKASVVLFSSLQGSLLLTTGALAVCHQYLAGRDRLEAAFTGQKWLLPLVLLAPLAVGLVIQYRISKGEDLAKAK